MHRVRTLSRRLVLVLGLLTILTLSIVSRNSTAERARTDRTRAALLATRTNKALGLRSSELVALKYDSTPAIAQRIALRLGAEPVVLDLTPHSVRSAEHYEVVAQQPDGSFATAAPSPLRTLRGTVVGRPGSRVAASVLEDGLYARVMLDDDTTWWVQPVPATVDGVTPSLHAAYRAEDVLPHGGSCANQAQAFDRERLEPLRHSLGSCGALCVAELACDADIEYFNDYGSVAATEARINSVINTVNLQYESEVAITHLITTIIVRTVSDPYTSTSPDGRLCEFITEWTNNQTAVVRDVAHLFTGVNIDGTTIGIAADIGGTGICVNNGSCFGGPFGPRGSYCLAESDFNGSFSCATDLSAHELGHLWGAFHCSCPSNTMNSGITCANTFGAGSISSITTYRDSRTCLSGSGTPVCGNGIVEAGEQCEPPNTSTCDANCQLTGNPACGSGAGDCCTANGTPGCDQTACCNSRCSADPFCCNNNWDTTCANDAATDPNCNCGSGSNDDCGNAFAIFDGNTSFDSTGATTDGPAHSECLDGFSDDQVGSDIWYDYTATCTGDLTVSLCGTASFDTKLALYDGCGCPPSTLIECDDDTTGCTGNTSEVGGSVVSGNCYKVRVGGFNGATGTGDININCVPVGCTPPDCDDGNICTTDVCNAGTCSNTPNALPCDDGNACTLNDACTGGSCGAGTPVDCSGASTECLSASCDSGGANGNCAILTPINEGGPCGGGAGVCTAGTCVVDPGGTALFLTADGLEEIADAGATNTMVLPSGGTGTVAVWLRNTDPDAVGGYQVGLPGAGTATTGSGSLTYLDAAGDGSVAVDETHPSWLYAGRSDATVFLSEAGLPDAFGFIGLLPLGQGEVVSEIAYLGEFELTSTPGTCGTFSLPFLPVGAPPNGGTSLVDEGGVDQVPAFLQSLQVTVGAPNDDCADATPLIGNDLSVDFDTGCATQDGATHACGTIGSDLWWSYTATCSGTLDISTTAGCTYDTAIAVYNNGAACTPAGGDLLSCTDTPGGCEATSTAVSIGDQLLIRVGSLGGATGTGTLTVTCTPGPTTPRVFVTRPGTEAAAPTSGPTSVVLGAGQTTTVEVWMADSASTDLGGYQIALQGRAVSHAATGTVIYSAGSVDIDTGDGDWAFAADQPPTFLSETGLPDGFALLAVLDIGNGTPIDGLAYLGTFAIRASATAEGDFTLNFLPSGAPPNGGSGLVDQTGVSAIAATYQPLNITVVPAAPCTTASDCGDLDGDTIIDDACFWYECDSGTCNSIARIFGDVGGSFGACPVDGFANIHDKNHVLTCFSGLNPCDPFNIDVGGPFGDCNPDGFCNVHDANHTLTAFSGATTCSCPLGGPMPEVSPAPAGTAGLRAVARTVGPDRVEVDILLTADVDALQSYQLDVQATVGPREVAPRLLDIRVDARRDRAVTGPTFQAFNVQRGQMLLGREDLVGVPAAADSYLATFVYEVSTKQQGAVSFAVTIDGASALIAEGQRPITIAESSAARVGPPRRR